VKIGEIGLGKGVVALAKKGANWTAVPRKSGKKKNRGGKKNQLNGRRNEETKKNITFLQRSADTDRRKQGS